MAVFKNRNGVEFVVSLDAPKIRAVRQAYNVDLASGELTDYAKIAGDPVLLVDILWELCRQDASARNITPEQFGSAISGDAWQSAVDALEDAIADFFPSDRANVLRQVYQTNREGRRAAAQLATEKIADPKIRDAMMAKVRADLDEAMRSAFATDSQAS